MLLRVDAEGTRDFGILLFEVACVFTALIRRIVTIDRPLTPKGIAHFTANARILAHWQSVT